MEDHTKQFELDTGPQRAFQSLTRENPQWWTLQSEGAAAHQNDRFTVRFGDSVFKTLEVAELKFGERVVWKVVDSIIDIPLLERKNTMDRHHDLLGHQGDGKQYGPHLDTPGIEPQNRMLWHL